jgi:NADP-dependent 3-hydroxy acid dehydrogenase YdfG
MVSLSEVQSSNSRIASALPAGLVAVFVGATSGIGETTLKQFAKHARQPRVYFVGRSQEAGDCITAECKALNSEGEYVFVKADTSLIRTVDDVCRDIKTKEKSVNLLFLSTGTLISQTSMSPILPEWFPFTRRIIGEDEKKCLTIVRMQRLQKASTLPQP